MRRPKPCSAGRRKLGPLHYETLNAEPAITETLKAQKHCPMPQPSCARRIRICIAGLDPTTVHQLATVLAALGEKEEAWARLQFATSRSLSKANLVNLAVNKELSLLPDHPQFAAIVEQAHRRADSK